MEVDLGVDPTVSRAVINEGWDRTMKRVNGVWMLMGLVCAMRAAALDLHVVPGGNDHHPGTRVWPDATPADCPIPRSTTFGGIGFTGRHARYTNADTWYPSWGADGRLYSPWTDGYIRDGFCKGNPDVGLVQPGKNSVQVGSGGEANAAVGHAIIEGDNPQALRVIQPGTIPGSALPYGGRYPSASLHHKGIWYLGTYGLAHVAGEPWGICGPFAGFHISKDNGKTWAPSPRSTAPGAAVFPEPDRLHGPVKFGAPHVVDFGRNMEHSPDGKMYMVAHGATQQEGFDRKANCGWLTGDHIYLCRVPPSPETVNDGTRYEFFGGHDMAGKPIWTRELALARPLVDWNNHCGIVTITYNAPLKKYLMCVSTAEHTSGPAYDTFLLEADAITGPYRLITYMKAFGTQGYFVNIPSKFISADGRTLWLCYSANWSRIYPDVSRQLRNDPPGSHENPASHYAMVLQEITLSIPGTRKK